MSIGSWDPTATATAAISDPILHRFIGYSRDHQLDQLATLLSSSERLNLAGLMHIEHPLWRQAVGGYSDEDLQLLLRFFAVAENLPGWEAVHKKSPVIPIARVLRERGVRLGRELLHWLRQVNDNRYLPYGPL